MDRHTSAPSYCEPIAKIPVVPKIKEFAHAGLPLENEADRAKTRLDWPLERRSGMVGRRERSWYIDHCRVIREAVRSGFGQTLGALRKLAVDHRAAIILG